MAFKESLLLKLHYRHGFAGETNWIRSGRASLALTFHWWTTVVHLSRRRRSRQDAVAESVLIGVAVAGGAPAYAPGDRHSAEQGVAPFTRRGVRRSFLHHSPCKGCLRGRLGPIRRNRQHPDLAGPARTCLHGPRGVGAAQAAAQTAQV